MPRRESLAQVQLYLGVNSPIACVALTLCGNLHPSVHMYDVDLYWLQVQLFVHTCIGCKCFFSLFTPLPLHFNMTRPSLRWERSEEIFARGRFKFWNWEHCLFLSKAGTKHNMVGVYEQCLFSSTAGRQHTLERCYTSDNSFVMICCGPLSNLFVTFSSKAKTCLNKDKRFHF